MFKKQLADLKTSAPLKNSDRKKLRQRVLQEYFDPAQSTTTEVGDLLVPDGLLSVKFTTSGGEPGLAYLSAEGEPLWFTLGKGSNELIPTVYTLWKRPRLLPHLSTPSGVIPVLQNGADLMAAGVIEMLGNPIEGSLVSITQYTPGGLGPPLAVGRMGMPGTKVRQEDAKGKAVRVLHVYKDKLWEMGGKGEPPEAEVLTPPSQAAEPSEVVKGEGKEAGEEEEEKPKEGDGTMEDVPEDSKSDATPPPSSPVEDAEIKEEDAPPPLSPQEVSSILRTSLIQAILTILSTLPQASFPFPSTTLYTQHILPSRPASLSSPSPSQSTSTMTKTPIDIKHSASKNLTSFLRLAEKEGLLRLKEQRGPGDRDPVLFIVSVNADHPDVQSHRVYETVGEAETRRVKREEREKERQGEAGRGKEVTVVELWKPHLKSVKLFEVTGKDSTTLYTTPQLKELINAYIVSHSLVNRNQQQFANVDDLLREMFSGSSKAKGKGMGEEVLVPEFLKREEIVKRLVEKMQPWYRIEVDRKDPILGKGKLHPIQITTKLRQGRKAATLLTNFEAFAEPLSLNAHALAEELRRSCASSTAVNQLPSGSGGGGGKAGMEVMVQGKQIAAVRELLLAKGVPKAWIEESDLIGKKKK